MSKVYKAVLAALAQKEADLDGMDNQLLEMDAVLPPEEMTNDFDMLAQKREELETNIRKMRERIELISAWDQLKNGDWSEEVKSLLKDLDLNIAEIADGATGAALPMQDPLAAPPAAVPPVAPGAPAPPTAAAPVSPEVPVEEPAAPVEEPLPAPVASKSSSTKKENNYEVQVKKGKTSPSTLTKDGTMTQTATKPALKTELAAAKTKRDITKDAQTRVASAWTIAKTMLPDAPPAIQKHFAANLLLNSTKVLTAALRQTAVNAYNTKLAESFKEVHKVELNDLLEDPSVLTKEHNAVKSEVKGDVKVADDRKDAGPQTETYNDGRGCGGGKHTEPAETDAGKAGERPASTVNKSEESDKTLKAAKQAGHDGCKGCPECQPKAATSKKADEPPAPPAEEAAPPAAGPEGVEPMPPAGPEGEAPAPELGEPGAAAESATVLTEEKKMDMTEKIDQAEEAIKGLLADIEGEETAAEEGISEMAELPAGGPEGAPAGGEEELNIENIFNQDDMEEKQSALANEGEGVEAADGMDSFFGPSASQDLEATLEPQTASIVDMFSLEGSDADPIAVLLGSKEAGDVAGIDVLPSFTSETAKHFESDTAKGDDRDAASDHESDIWAEALESLKVEEQGAVRTKQDETNVLEKAPEAKKAAYTGPIKAAAPKTATDINVGEALMGSFIGDE
jgi:hypothetical protein